MLCRFVLLSDEFGTLDCYHLNMFSLVAKPSILFTSLPSPGGPFFSPLIRMGQFFARVFETPFYEGGKFEVPHQSSAEKRGSVYLADTPTDG